jgi:FlaG/FlaF family flagellin (archaellin)
MRSRFVRAAVLLCLALAAAACSKSLDMDGLELQLADQLNTQLETTGITVDCPDDVEAETGGEFDCTGTASTGDTLTIRVTQTDSDGSVTWEVVDVATGPAGST